MKKSMSDYLNAMTSGKLENFENIISHQYRKFKKFYYMIKDYSESITKVKYEFLDKHTLNVSLTFETKRRLSDIKKELESSIEGTDYQCEFKISKKVMKLAITYKESE